MKTCHPDCTVLVASCDRYADILVYFETLFARYWPACPFETVLVTETARGVDGSGVFAREVACGPGGNWAGRLVAALETVTTPYVLMLCDDYLLDRPVDTARLLVRLGQAKRYNAANLRLIPNPRPNGPRIDEADPPLASYRKNTAYSIATQSGFWARDFLLRLAREATSIWDFERLGSFSCGDETRPLLVTPDKEFPFVDAVHKGCWEPFGVKTLEANGLKPDFAVRGLPGLKTRLVEGLKGFVFHLVPLDWLVRAQNALGLGAKEPAQRR